MSRAYSDELDRQAWNPPPDALDADREAADLAARAADLGAEPPADWPTAEEIAEFEEHQRRTRHVAQDDAAQRGI
jgi:hypothetical protein